MTTPLQVTWPLLLALALTVGGCASTPKSKVDVTRLLEDYYSFQSTDAIDPGITDAEGRRAQNTLVRLMAARNDEKAGYKVGLVTEESQKKYKVSEPVWGVLFPSMLLDNQASVPAQFGVRPLCEADLAVRVKDDGINKARNVLEVAEHLSYVVAFIELPDAFIATNAPVTGAMLTAANVGARLAIVGQRMAVEPTAAFVEALATMRVTMKDQDGNILGQGKGSDILDHPLHSVLWLNEQLKREGLELKEGDLISLGGLNMLTPRSGQTITVVYEGLPDGPISASVQFQ